MIARACGGWQPLLLLVLSGLAYAGMASMTIRHGKLGEQVTGEFLVWYGLATALFWVSLLWSEQRGRFERRWLWGGAILFRLLLLTTTPTLSTDVYRYLWDGHVAVNGVSPYAYAIEAPELDRYQHPVRDQANHTWMASPYLPAAQALFAGLARLFPLEARVIQVIMTVSELVAGLLVTRLLALTELPERRLVLYLWNPLLIVESAHGAHLDAFMLLLTMAAIWTAILTGRGGLRPVQQERLARFAPQLRLPVWSRRALAIPLYGLSPLLLALATLTKIIPGLLTVVLFWQWSWKQRIGYGALTLCLLLPAGLRAGWGLSGALDGRGLFGALRIYADRWNFNSGIFHWLEETLASAGVEDYNSWAKRIALLALLTLLASVWLQARGARHPRTVVRWLAVPLAGYILLTATVHPWYLLVLLPFLPFLPPAPGEGTRIWLLVLPWLWLAAALPLSYLTYIDPSDLRELEWVRRLEWLPALAILLVAWPVTGRKTGRSE